MFYKKTDCFFDNIFSSPVYIHSKSEYIPLQKSRSPIFKTSKVFYHISDNTLV